MLFKNTLDFSLSLWYNVPCKVVLYFGKSSLSSVRHISLSSLRSDKKEKI